MTDPTSHQIPESARADYLRRATQFVLWPRILRRTKDPASVVVLGPDLETARPVADQIARELRSAGGCAHVDLGLMRMFVHGADPELVDQIASEFARRAVDREAHLVMAVEPSSEGLCHWVARLCLTACRSVTLVVVRGAAGYTDPCFRFAQRACEADGWSHVAVVGPRSHEQGLPTSTSNLTSNALNSLFERTSLASVVPNTPSPENAVEADADSGAVKEVATSVGTSQRSEDTTTGKPPYSLPVSEPEPEYIEIRSGSSVIRVRKPTKRKSSPIKSSAPSSPPAPAPTPETLRPTQSQQPKSPAEQSQPPVSAPPPPRVSDAQESRHSDASPVRSAHPDVVKNRLEQIERIRRRSGGD